MAKLRKFILVDLFMEVAFWLGALHGIIFGLSFAQKKGSQLREEVKDRWEKKGFQAVREAMTDELKDSGKEAWTVTRDAVMGTEAYKTARQKTEEIWSDFDPETQRVIRDSLDRTKRTVKNTAERAGVEMKKASMQAKSKMSVVSDRVRREAKSVAREAESRAQKEMAKVKRTAAEKAQKAVKQVKKKAQKKVAKVKKQVRRAIAHK